jgi:RsiW-degrading membrane proteinase PrsW (M82 family)
VVSTQPNPEQRGETSRKKSITESPWYWVYLFSTAVLIAIVLLGPKIIERQTIDERNYQARQRTYQQASGEQPDIPLSTNDNQLITLQPLIITFAIVLAVSWIILWYKHFYRRDQEPLAKDVEDPVVQGSQD